MFQPISFNVIRQALEWHGFPVPKLRQLSLNDHDPDLVTGEYVATWTDDQVRAVTGYETVYLSKYADLAFTAKLKECFCDDIQVDGDTSQTVRGSYQYVITVKVARSLLYWAHLLEEIYT